MSCFIYVEFITKKLFTNNTNITTKLNRKLFTKVIGASKEAWVCIDRESNTEKHKHFNLERID